jgi:hypothetical protein
MTTNILGPGHYADTGETTSRPAHAAPLDAVNHTWFQECNLPGTPGTSVDALWANGLMAQLRNVIVKSGADQFASGADTDDMTGESIARYASGAIYCTDGGAANAAVLSLTGTFVKPRAYFDGMEVQFNPAAVNTGAATAAAFGLAAKSIVKVSGAVLTGGELRPPTVLRYNLATDKWILMPWSGLQFSLESARYRLTPAQTYVGGAGAFQTLSNWSGTDPSFGAMAAGAFTLSRAGTYIFEASLTSDWANPFTVNLQTDTTEVTALGYSVGGASSGCSASVTVSKAIKGQVFKALAFFNGAGNPVAKVGNVFAGFTGYTQLTVSRIGD